MTVNVFSICNTAENTSKFYLSNERCAGERPDETSSCVYDYVITEIPQRVKRLHMFAGNCSGQNKTNVILSFLNFSRHNWFEQLVQNSKYYHYEIKHLALGMTKVKAYIDGSCSSTFIITWKKFPHVRHFRVLKLTKLANLRVFHSYLPRTPRIQSFLSFLNKRNNEWCILCIWLK